MEEAELMALSMTKETMDEEGEECGFLDVLVLQIDGDACCLLDGDKDVRNVVGGDVLGVLDIDVSFRDLVERDGEVCDSASKDGLACCLVDDLRCRGPFRR